MIVAWLFIMFLDLSFWMVDMFHMSLDLCRFCLVTMLCRSWFRLVFSRLCWMTWKSSLSPLRWRKTPCALMKHKMRQFSWRAKRLCCHYIESCVNLFSGLMFFLACDKMLQESFAAIGEWIVDVKEFTRGTWFLVGRLEVFQVQREQWVSSN